MGRLGLTSPPSPVLCSATTAPCPSRVASLVTRSPIPWLLPWFVFPIGLGDRRKLSATAGALGQPVPLLFRPSLPRRHVTLPSSRVLPVTPCPALRPRWGPNHLPERGRDCCLPLVPPRRLWLPSLCCAVILWSTTIHISGLHHTAWRLAPSGSILPLRGLHAEFAATLQARLWVGGT
jgi:hypothetical protein